jgi:ABC-type glycerol-3-phosphate transport system substrate-binding protein
MSTTYINGLTIQTNNKMKKVIAMLALASLMVACGGKGTTEGTTDSTAVAADTTATK